ncbi:MAG TPA: phytoene desaturase family protein [Candidatus Nitrosotalea sp.]|jgi:phytoene desaturase|nr:phytoene desaturase family protein [Candidatus Nitrosotalea sp.]
MRRAIVVGAGIGGLAAGIRLAARGWRVTMFDKNREPGGRMSTVTAGGFSWDVGPTLIMMPEVLRELFAAAGRRLEDYVELTRVDPYYRVVFEDAGHLDLTGNLPDMVANVEALEPGAGPRYLEFLGAAERLSRRTRDAIVERRFGGLSDLARPDVLLALLRARPLSSVADVVAAHFRSPRLRRAFSFQTLYLGTSPARTPAAYVMIPFVEAALGVWYPRGGVHRIALGLAALARELGVDLQLGTPVDRIVTDNGRATGVLVEGAVEPADVVVSNADWAYTQERLLDHGERVAGRDFGCSGVLFLIAVRGTVVGPHHTFLLSRDFDGNLADLFERRRLPEQPSIYLSRPTATDASLAPAGTELLYVLVPSPNLESGVDWRAELPGFRARVLTRLAAAGLGDLESRIVAETALTPEDFGARYNLAAGSAFGLAATLLQSGPFRPTIRSRRYGGLYHVGASSHPGGGVPIVALSGRMAAEAIEEDWLAATHRTRAAVLPAARGRWSGASS